MVEWWKGRLTEDGDDEDEDEGDGAGHFGAGGWLGAFAWMWGFVRRGRCVVVDGRYLMRR